MRLFSMLLLLLALLFAIACTSKTTSADTDAMALTTNVDAAQLRAAPGPDGKVLLSLPFGAVLYDLGEVSDFTTRINLRGIWFDEPWLKVRTKDGQIGWIYGGALRFQMDDNSATARLLMQKRLQTIFGAALEDSIRNYRLAFHAIQTAEDFANVFRQGTKLRDTMTNIMQERILIQDYDALPDMFWLTEAMPGMVPQLVAEGTSYFLFWNFAILQTIAQRTANTADDGFVAFNITLFPEDSIEYFFPAWFMQTWDYGGSSLLGRGVHYNTLQQIAQQLQQSDLFAKELKRLKARLLNDMTESHVTYWESQEKILAELDRILSADFHILDNADRIALQTRRQQFNDPQQFGIQVNMQSGTYE